MKRKTQNISSLFPLLASQTGEEKLRIAFDLSKFVKKLRKEGEKYEKTIKGSGAGRTA